jgi:HEAT repeat protein
VMVVERALDRLQCNLLNEHEIIPLLASLARSKGSSSVSSAAIVAAGRCQVTAVCATLVDALFRSSPDEADAPQSRSLVTAIGQCCGRAGREPLEEFVSARASATEMRRVAVSNIQSAREAAVAILGEIGTAASLPALKWSRAISSMWCLIACPHVSR